VHNLRVACHSLSVSVACKSAQYQNRNYSTPALFNPEERLPRFIKSDAVKQELKTRVGAQGIKKGV
jgi:hypothetical protein